MNSSCGYPLGYNQEEAHRLEGTAAFLEDLTEDVLRRAGIKSGMQVLDLGCGVGDVSLLASRMVGATGAVLGLDRSASSLETARRRASTLGVGNIQFEMTELDSFDTARTFDAAIGRLVLGHLRDPSETLRRIRGCLTPNGVIAFQELDVQLEMQVPASQLYTRVRSWIISGLSAGGSEPCMGSKLLSVFLSAGLPRPTMIMGGRVESGSDSKSYDLLASIIRSLLPLLERDGIATAEEVAIDTLADRLRQEAIANECVTFFPSLVGAWVRLPKS